MSDKKTFILAHDTARKLAAEYCMIAPDGYAVEISEPKRTPEQSAKFHAICGDVSKSGIKWAGKERNEHEWKRIFISAHGVATGEKAEFIVGLENEILDVRERTSGMRVARMASLIEYTLAWCAGNDVRLSAREDRK